MCAMRGVFDEPLKRPMVRRRPKTIDSTRIASAASVRVPATCSDCIVLTFGRNVVWRLRVTRVLDEIVDQLVQQP